MYLMLRYRAVYLRRNGFVNVALAIAVTITVLGGALALLFKVMNVEAMALGITWAFHPLFYVHHMARFLAGNRKKEILPAFIGSTCVWTAHDYSKENLKSDIGKLCDGGVYRVLDNTTVMFVDHRDPEIVKEIYNASIWKKQ